MRQGCLMFMACVAALLGPGAAGASAALDQGELEEIAAEAHARIAARAGVPFTMSVVVSTTKQKAPPGEEDEDAYAYQDQALSTESTCAVVVTKLGVQQSVPEARVTMLHEVTHCLELQLNKGQSTPPHWVSEGGADYVAATLGEAWNGGADDAGIADTWRAYFGSAAESLLQRRYTAMAFFVGLENADLDVMKLLPVLFAAKDPEQESYRLAMDAALAASGRRFVETLASSIVRRPAFGKGWTISGPSLPKAGPGTRLAVPKRVVVKGKPVTLKIPAYGVRGATIAPQGQVLVVEIADTEATVGSFHTADSSELAAGAYCVKGSCACPGGGDALPRLGDAPVLAAYGDGKAGAVTLRVSTKKAACSASATNVRVSGNFNWVYAKDGSCTAPLSTGDVQVFFIEYDDGHSRQLTLTLEDFHGPGTYEAPPSRVTFHAGELTTWTTFVRNEPPEYPSSGVVEVTSAAADGMRGTVSATMHAPNDEANAVSVVGSWRCS